MKIYRAVFMDELLCTARELRDGSLRKVVDQRMSEFEELGNRGDNELFKELCFCILTANYTAEGGIRIQKALGDGFLDLPKETLSSRLRELGYRFPNVRADFIVKARRQAGGLRSVLSMEPSQARQWLVENVRGLGMKEASHFLRNVGFTDVAIVDFHIVDILERHGMIERPKMLTPARYLEIEEVLRGFAGKVGMSLGELDLYLWYCETGKVLK